MRHPADRQLTGVSAPATKASSGFGADEAQRSKGDRTSQHLSLLEALLLAVSVAVPSILLIGYLLDGAGWPITPLPVALLSILVLGATAYLARRSDLHLRLALAPSVAGLLAGGAVAGYLVWLSWPAMYPTGFSVDAVHHYQLVDYIYQHHSLVHDQGAKANLGEMTVYPWGATLLVAFLAWVLAQAPLVLMQPVVAVSLALSVLFVYAAIVELATDRRLVWLAGLLGVSTLLIPYGYFIGQCTEQYYFTQVFAQAWLMALLFWLVKLQRAGNQLFLLPLLLSACAVALAYPTWLPFAGLTAAIMLISDRAVRTTTRLRRVAILLAPLGLLLFIFLKDRWEGGLSIVKGEGVTLSPGLDTLGIVFVALALGGLALALRNRQRLTVAVFAAALALQMLATYGAAALGLASYYSADKMWYGLIFPMAIFAGLASSEAISFLGTLRVRGRYPLLLYLACVLPFVLVAKTVVERPGPRPPTISPDLVSVATWYRENLSHEPSLTISQSRLAAYWVDIGLLKVPRSRAKTNELLYSPLPTFDAWYWASDQPRYALLDRLDADPPLGGKVIFRTGQAAVVTRLGIEPCPPSSAQGTAEPLRTAEGLIVTGPPCLSQRYHPGEAVLLPLRVRVAALTGQRYLLAAHLYDQAGKVWSEAQIPVQRIEDNPPADLVLSLNLSGDIPTGAYQIEVFVLALPSYSHLPLRGWESPDERRLLVGPIVITSASDVLPVSAISPVRKAESYLDSQFALRGWDPPSGPAHPGTLVRVVLYWEAVADPKGDYVVFLHLVGPDLRPVAQDDGYPLGGRYPTSVWKRTEVVRQTIDLSLPPGLAPGTYRLLAGMYSPKTMERLPVHAGSGPSTGDSVDLGPVLVVE